MSLAFLYSKILVLPLLFSSLARYIHQSSRKHTHSLSACGCLTDCQVVRMVPVTNSHILVDQNRDSVAGVLLWQLSLQDDRGLMRSDCAHLYCG